MENIRDALLALQKTALINNLNTIFEQEIFTQSQGEIVAEIDGLTDVSMDVSAEDDLTSNEYAVCIEEELFRQERVRHQYKVLIFGFLSSAIFVMGVVMNYCVFPSYAHPEQQDLIMNDPPVLLLDEVMSSGEGDFSPTRYEPIFSPVHTDSE